MKRSAVVVSLLLNGSAIEAMAAAAVTLQLEGGVFEGKNPLDDQYVLYHGNGLSYGVQMTSPVIGIAPRLDIGNVVLTAGYRDMGHQYIETDIIPDNIYFGCRFNGNCPTRMERWELRMGLQELYASVGYKFHLGSFSVVPTAGIAEERMANTIEVEYPYAEITKYNAGYHAGHAPTWYAGNHQDQAHPFLGLDVERGRWGLGVYYMDTCNLPTSMGDPGLGSHGIYTRITYRVGL